MVQRINKNSYNKGEEAFFKTVMGVWLLGVLGIIAFWAVVIFVAVHFITKFW